MDIKEWISILSVIILVVEWFTNSWLNRRNEIAKVRIKYRLDTLISIVDLLPELQENIDNKIQEKINNKESISFLRKKITVITYKFALYGKKGRNRKMEFIHRCN